MEVWILSVLLMLICGSGSEEVSTSRCGEYQNQVMEDGTCRLEATLPQLDVARCPDVFRCTDEVSFWLHENEERKQQILDLHEIVSQLQEDLRNHRHRLKVLELQTEQKVFPNSSVDRRFHHLELQYDDVTTLLHVQGSILSQLQNHIHNVSLQVENMRKNPGCMINVVRTGHSKQKMLHPELQRVRNCPIDCASIYYNGVRQSGVYTVVPSLGAKPVEVYCDMDTDGGGWTVIQRRLDGSVNFDRGWKEYKEGFGDLNGEYWLGNQHIHDVSTQGDYTLRIELEDWSSKRKHALYQNFRLENEVSHYRLHVSGFSGTVEDSFGWYHDRQDFRTPDTGNICAEIAHAGWWYNQCYYANLNGVYHQGGRYSQKGPNALGPTGIVWYTWKDSDYYSLRKVTMMIRPRVFRPHLSP